MPGWLPRVLIRIHEFAKQRRVRITLKAQRESAALGFDLTDIRDILVQLTRNDSAGRFRSTSTHEWLYLFKPQMTAMVLYVKLVLRSDCLLVSFHEDEGIDDDANT